MSIHLADSAPGPMRIKCFHCNQKLSRKQLRWYCSECEAVLCDGHYITHLHYHATLEKLS